MRNFRAYFNFHNLWHMRNAGGRHLIESKYYVRMAMYQTHGASDIEPDTSESLAVLIITVRYRPFPVQLAHAAGQCSFPADKMADRKRSGSLGESSSCSKRLKRQVTVATCEKWQREFDRDYQTLLWLRCDVDTAN